MKRIPLFLLILVSIPSFSQLPDQAGENLKDSELRIEKKDHLNFFIITKRKKGKLDLATRFNILRTKLRGHSHRNTFVSIIVTDSKDMVRKVTRKLEDNNSMMGTIWFDSHGSYKKGYSMFFVGKDECNTKTLRNDQFNKPFTELSSFADEQTKIIIGSCYGGATYFRSSVDYKDTMRMDGDSLMMSLGKLFPKATVYGSESWVMSKPGLFHRRPAVGGNPGRKLFLDVCYKPVWETIGVWNQYNASMQQFGRSNTIALDESGNLVIRDKPYIEEKKLSKEIQKRLRKLQPGLFK